MRTDAARTEELLALGVFGRGSRLGDRIELLLNRRREFSPGASMARMAMSAAALLLFVIGSSLAPHWVAFAQRLEFEAASVRADPDGRGTPNYSAQGINFRGVSLALIIAEAYNTPGGRIIGPDSLNKESLWNSLSSGYDVVATAGHAVSRSQLRLMLQTLLEDRFKLKLHYESKLVPVYKLVMGKNAATLDQAEVEGGFSASFTKDGVVFRNASMTRLIGFLRVDRPVVDQTGLTGAYNFTLRLEPLGEGAKTDPLPDDPFIFTEIQKLGLKLVADKAAVDYPVIDRLEQPDAN